MIVRFDENPIERQSANDCGSTHEASDIGGDTKDARKELPALALFSLNAEGEKPK